MDSFAFIWDVDGTLVDSYPAIVPATQRALSEHGLDLPAEYILEQVIRTSVGTFIKDLAAARGVDPAPIQARFDQLNDSRIEAITGMPHAAETLSALMRAGHANFVYTHRGASCHAILRQTGLLPLFTEVVTAEEGFPRKPAPDAILYLMAKYGLACDRCFYVGDRSLDVDAANNAGIGSILFLDPASPGKVTGRETYVVHDLIEIRALVNKWDLLN